MRVDFLTSNEASAEGAMAAGLKVYIGYPITPSSDLFEYLAEKLPKCCGIVYQAEDEIASIIAMIGASLAGAKVMTATSGPGFSLMQEGIGLAIMLEAPLVIVNNMRTGPSTGIATQIGQGDIMQARWGSHGPYNLVAYAPSSAQEAFDYTIKAFNTAVKFRVPVVVLMDAILAHTREKVVIKDKDEIEVIEFKKTNLSPEDFSPYKPDPDDLVPPFAFFGEGYSVLAESLAHDERGYYNTSPEVYNKLVKRFIEKIERGRSFISSSRRYYIDDAEILFIAIGSMARSTLALVKDLRKEGKKVGLFRPISIWPMDDRNLLDSLDGVKKIIIPELNQGQLEWIIKKILWDNNIRDIEIYSLPMLTPDLPGPDDILDEINRRGIEI